MTRDGTPNVRGRDRVRSGMLWAFVLDGRSGLRPRSIRRPISIPHPALTGPRQRAGGPRQELHLSCPSINSGLRPSSSASSRTRATPSPPPSRTRRSRSSSPAATCSPAPRPGTGKTAAFVLPILQLLKADGLPDRRLRRAIATRTPAATRDATRRRSAPRPHPDPRARAPGRGERPHLRRAPPDPLDHDLRRRRLRPAGPRPAGRPRDRRRHARPPARPRRAAHDRPEPGRDPRPRRGRPDARHGLHPRHPQDHRPAPGQAPEPAVLGDVLDDIRRLAAGILDRPGIGPGHAHEHGARARRAARLPRSTASASASS